MLDRPSYLCDVFFLTETTISGALKILLLLTIDAVMISILFNLCYSVLSRDSPYYIKLVY